MSVRERIVMNHRHTRARALDVATRRVDRGVRTFFVSPDRVVARARERSIERASADSSDRDRGSIRWTFRASRDGLVARRTRASVEFARGSFVDRFVDVSRSHRGRARAVVDSIRFD